MVSLLGLCFYIVTRALYKIIEHYFMKNSLSLVYRYPRSSRCFKRCINRKKAKLVDSSTKYTTEYDIISRKFILKDLKNFYNETCSICLNDYSEKTENDLEVVILPYCMHVYHKDCIFEWMKTKPSCP